MSQAGRITFGVYGDADTQESKTMEKPIEERIRERAYVLWELAGKLEGQEHEFWHEAEKAIKREIEDVSVIAQPPEPMSF
jgi:hypothetical protein